MKRQSRIARWQENTGISFYPRPLPLLAIGFGAGVLCARALLGRGAAPAALAAMILAGLALLWNRAGAGAVREDTPIARHRRWALPLLLLGLAGGIARALLAYPALPAPRESCVLTGIVAETPRQGPGGTELLLRAAAVDGTPIQGRVRLYLAAQLGEAQQAWEYGAHVQAAAALTLPQGRRGEGGRDWRSYYLAKGVSCTALAGAGDALCVGQSPPGLYGRLLALRQATTRALVDMMGEENGTLAAGMLHGDTTGIPEEALTSFRAAGIAHLLAVSGLHVGILTGALLFLLRRLRPWPQLGMLAGMLVLYCLFTALSPSTLRASLMALCMLAGRALRRRGDSASSLSLAFLLILLASPFSLFAVGLQLSFTAVLGILLLTPALKQALHKVLPGAIGEGLATSIAGQAGILPATAAYFGQMPLLAVAANLVIIPLAGLIVLPALLGVLCYPLLPGAARAIAAVAGATLTLVRTVADAAAGAGAVSLPAPGLAAGVLFFLALLVCSPLFRGEGREKRRVAFACTGLMLCCWCAPILMRAQPHVTVLDGEAVGGGYVAHLHTPGEDRLLAGGAPRQYALEQYLTANGVRTALLEQGEREGAQLQLGAHTLLVTPTYVEAAGVRYDRAACGQLRFTLRGGSLRGGSLRGGSLRGGSLRVRAYADDARYAILIREDRAGG